MLKIDLLKITFTVLLLPTIVYGQHTIYFDNGNSFSNSMLTKIENGQIYYEIRKIDKVISRSMGISKIPIVFDDYGNYVIFSGSEEECSKQLTTFLRLPPRKILEDVIIKAVPLTVILGTIILENENIINYQTKENQSASINTNEVVAFVKKNGHHKIFFAAIEAAPLLASALPQLLGISDIIVNNPSPTAKPIPQSLPLQKDDLVTGNHNVTNQPETPHQHTMVSESLVDKPINQTVHTSGSHVLSTKPRPSQPVVLQEQAKPSLTEQDYERYQSKALQKVDEFSGYLNIIADKSLSGDDKDKAIEQAVKLFMPSAMIEVTSNGRSGSRQYKIKDYLTRLKLLPYGSTNIEWTEIQYIKELKQEADGNYYGNISGQQTFTGYSKNGKDILYSDVTQKNVKVKLQSYQKIIEGKDAVSWEVLLGNIGVGTTK